MPSSIEADGERGDARSWAAVLLDGGRASQLSGQLDGAAEAYAEAVDAAAVAGELDVQAEALRRLGIVHHLRGEVEAAWEYCRQSREMALAAEADVLAAEAVMALANISCETGRMDDATHAYREAADLCAGDPDVTARIEQNLGILDTIRGDLTAALGHHRRAHEAYGETENRLGRAMTHHNIGMIYADQHLWHQAFAEYEQAGTLARQCGDRHLEALCLLNQAEADVTQGRYREARQGAELALGMFGRLGARRDQGDAFRVVGMALRFLNRPTLAESRFRSAIHIAMTCGSELSEAEACRELAGLYGATGRCGEATILHDRALGLFRHLGAQRESAELLDRKDVANA